MGKVDDTLRHIAYVRQQSDGAVLFCSLGKDSLVCLDLMYPRFSRIVCVFMYFVKDLDHIDRWIICSVAECIAFPTRTSNC